MKFGVVMHIGPPNPAGS